MFDELLDRLPESPLGEGAGDCVVGAVGTCLHVSPLWTLQRSRFRTGPDVAAARADRGENHDPGGAT